MKVVSGGEFTFAVFTSAIVVPSLSSRGTYVLVLLHWFSYRKANRERPIIGDRRAPSPLGDIQPDYWLAEYTTELINLLNVLGLLVDLEPKQAELLEKICSGPLISADELANAGALATPSKPRVKTAKMQGPDLFGTASDPES